ncbi:hypothetical protein VNO77_34130 [Canavalia gladiata]|uniref:Uncharacterized protein n=1 Tax=Canavalia gladiata TaxID=3824 RepID=A0AAN9PZJ0_CANGL
MKVWCKRGSKPGPRICHTIGLCELMTYNVQYNYYKRLQGKTYMCGLARTWLNLGWTMTTMVSSNSPWSHDMICMRDGSNYRPLPSKKLWMGLYCMKLLVGRVLTRIEGEAYPKAGPVRSANPRRMDAFPNGRFICMGHKLPEPELGFIDTQPRDCKICLNTDLDAVDSPMLRLVARVTFKKDFASKERARTP